VSGPCFDVTPEGLYDANMAACCGCGVCEAVCPVAIASRCREIAFAIMPVMGDVEEG